MISSPLLCQLRRSEPSAQVCRASVVASFVIALAGCAGAGGGVMEADRADHQAIASSGGALHHDGGHGATSHRRFDDVAFWTRIFDDPDRNAWQRPEALVEAIGVAPGMRVADLGAGTGYLLPHLAQAVGGAGKVYALEVETTLVEHLRARAKRDGLRNVVAVVTARDRPSLDPASVDLIVILDTYHHLDDRLRYLARLRDVLAPGGRLAIVDWKAGDLPVGPAADHKLPAAHVKAELDLAGYRLLAEPAVLPHQYVLLFQPSE